VRLFSAKSLRGVVVAEYRPRHTLLQVVPTDAP
jgi:hypothetical protein